MKKTMVRPVSVDVYECDSPLCDAICEFGNWPGAGPIDTATGVKSGCEWIQMIDWTHPKDPARKHNDAIHGYSIWQGDARRYFCCWGCVSEWALAIADAENEKPRDKD